MQNYSRIQLQHCYTDVPFPSFFEWKGIYKLEWLGGENAHLSPMWPRFDMSYMYNHVCACRLSLFLALVLAPMIFQWDPQFSSFHKSEHCHLYNSVHTVCGYTNYPMLHFLNN